MANKKLPTTLEISLLGNPIIRATAANVERVKDKEIQNLIKNLITTVKKVDGVGIAAPQVNKSLRLLIVASSPNNRYPQAPKMTPLAAINPKVLFVSTTMVPGWEGCLSVPGIRGLVQRHESITLEYTTKTDKKMIKTFTGFIARIFQHELDHLDGKVFIDRVETTHDIISEKEYLKLIKKYIRPLTQKDE